LTGRSISPRVLTHGPELLRTRVARVLAPGGRGGYALVTVTICRETDAALHHSGADDAFGDVGYDALRDGGQNSPTAAVVRITRAPHRKGSERPVRRASFLSQGRAVRSIARL